MKWMLSSLAVTLAVGLSAAQQDTAQPPDPNVPLYFEVASIKPNKSGEPGGMMRRQPGGRMNSVNMPLRQLIAFAYQATPFTLVGGPAWIAQDRFDIVAKIDGDPPPIAMGAGPDHMMLAMRTLLADRFKLKVHREMRDLDAYALVMAKAGAGPGPKLKQTTQDCSPEAMRAMFGRGGAPPVPPPLQAGVTIPCGARIMPGRIQMGGLPIATVVGPLGGMVGRIVVDRTGLTGGWDFELTFTPEAGRGSPPPGANVPPPDPDAPSIFAALPEQLGLKLESTKAPTEVIVIDSVEQPTPD